MHCSLPYLKKEGLFLGPRDLDPHVLRAHITDGSALNKQNARTGDLLLRLHLSSGLALVEGLNFPSYANT